MSDGDVSEVERILEDYFVSQGLGHPGKSESRSWRNSLPVLARDLRDAGLGAVEVLAEHRLPLSSKRADVILAGTHPRTGAPSYVVVELKQWSTARRWQDSATLVDVDGARYSPVLHPALQVAGYASYLTDFVTVLADQPDPLASVAYLHNATDRSIADLWSGPAASEARMFTGQRRGEFHEFLRSRLSPNSGVAAADELLASSIAPSKQLLQVAANEIRDREQFVLLDEQRVAYEIVMRAVEQARASDLKTVVVVTGGPGSGKSVIALSLLGELARQGRTVLHATGSKAFTHTLRQVAGKGSSRTKSLFMYFNSFMTAERNGLDVLILDEAHRIRAQSVNRYTPKAIRAVARPQIEELLDAARVPVFLLDQHQVVRPGEMGTAADIKAHAAAKGLTVHQIDLQGQYRAGGSDAYNDWVHRLLGLLDDGGPLGWEDESTFAVDVVDSPAELESRLAVYRDKGLGARMTAGYCWRWSDPTPDGRLVDDVTIGDWSRPWNLKSERAVGEAPPSSLWASDPGGFGQVGCVYTAQGFEYHWNGVIFGPDLVWRTDRWVSRREFNKDPDFKSVKTVSNETFDRLVRHVYKVLLTRGLTGTLVYSVDPETQAMLRRVVNPR
ncbi:DNA/RNA helicase domain-containing protein [Pengzhenrongella phosphoraccumulans]|uniref:DNA/RNA helicase domain-containing protein n=1 Tax=Pengzhenrongella phosphoraccumulans TaxID=3114394 RepID=UPI00388E86EE